jgi:hypothetical protein
LYTWFVKQVVLDLDKKGFAMQANVERERLSTGAEVATVKTNKKQLARLTFQTTKGTRRLPCAARPHSCGKAERHLASMQDLVSLGKQDRNAKRYQRYLDRMNNGKTFA